MKISEAVISDIIIMHEQGMSIPEIVEATGCTLYRVRKTLNDTYGKLKNGRKKFDNKSLCGKTLALWNSGLENTELIAAKLGVSKHSVNFALNINGIKTRQKYQPIDLEILDIANKNKGIIPFGTCEMLGKKHGVSRQAVNLHIKKLQKRGEVISCQTSKKSQKVAESEPK